MITLKGKVKLYVLKNTALKIGNQEFSVIAPYIRDKFYSEMGWLIHQVGDRPAIKTWLQAQGLNVANSRCDMVSLGIDWGLVTVHSTEWEIGRFLDAYWDMVANAVLDIIAVIESDDDE